MEDAAVPRHQWVGADSGISPEGNQEERWGMEQLVMLFQENSPQHPLIACTGYERVLQAMRECCRL